MDYLIAYFTIAVGVFVVIKLFAFSEYRESEARIERILRREAVGQELTDDEVMTIVCQNRKWLPWCNCNAPVFSLFWLPALLAYAVVGLVYLIGTFYYFCLVFEGEYLPDWKIRSWKRKHKDAEYYRKRVGIK